MKIHLLGNYSERYKAGNQNFLNYTSENMKKTELYETNLNNTNYIVKKSIRQPSVRPSTGHGKTNSISIHRSQSIENPRDRLYTGNIEEYSIGQILGYGAYAVVKLATYLPNKDQYAIKTYEKFKLLDPQRKKNVISEIKILKCIDHPNIIKIKEAIESTKQIHIVMEYVGGCSLWSYIKKKPQRQLSESTARRYLTQILSGISYCHDLNIIHRDIKLENILLDSSNNVKIIDFGFATFTDPESKIKLFCGTPSYMSPEIVGKRENPGAPADIWALGVLLYVMLAGTFPFKSTSDRDLYRLILKGTFDIPASISSSAKVLIRKMLSQDPKKRPTCTQVLNDHWILDQKPRDCNFSDSIYATKVPDKRITPVYKRSDEENID